MEHAHRSPTPQRQRLAVAGAVLVMASIGTLYAWSIFVAPIEAAFGRSRAATSLVFSLATAAFTIGMLAGPSLLRRWSPHAVALFSCLLAAAGLALAAADSIWLVALGFGVLFGLANGFAYGSSLQVVQHAAPHRPGLFTGIAVASYMLGSAAGAPLLSAATQAWSYRLALLILAAWLAAAGMLASLLLRRSRIADVIAADRSAAATVRPPFAAMAILWGVFLLGSLVGLMTLAHAAPLAASFPGGEHRLALAAALVALGNGAGRLAGGWLSDRLDPRTLLCGAPALIGAALAAVLVLPRLDVLLAALCAVGVGYGCLAGCLPAIVARSYGPAALTRLYGRLFTAWGLAGLAAPYLGGLLFDRHGDYTAANAAAALAALAAALLGLTFKPPARPRERP